MQRDLIKAIKAVLCVLVIDGCGGTLGGNPERTLTDNPDTGTAPGTGSSTAALTISLTDAPIEDARNVYISVESVQIAQSQDTWLTIPLKNGTEFDLLALQDGTSIVLGAIDSLPAGTYGQTRLILTEKAPGRLIDKDGVEHELLIPSGSESGLKIQTSFTKVEGTSVGLTIDFDLRKSVHLVGNATKNKYMLKPKLRLTDDSKIGSISGAAATGSVICVYANGATRDTADTCETAVTSASAKNGKYKVANLDPGTYDLRIFTAGVVAKDIEDVVVAVGKDTEPTTVDPVETVQPDDSDAEETEDDE